MSLLYVHPSGHVNDAVVPAGAIAAVSSVECEKLGRYAFEVSDDELRRAKVLAMDLHWALALPSVEAIVRHARASNPGLDIVLGGISAGLWPERLLAEDLADYVVQGDAEPGFAALVAALVAGREPPALPNVWAKGRGAPTSSRVDSDALNASESLWAPWFPSYERLQQVSARAVSHDRMLAVVRGCALRCPSCYGSFAGSFGAGTPTRSPDSIVQSVRRAEAIGTRHLVLIFGKVAPGLLRACARALAKAGPFGIREHVGVFCCQPPDAETLSALRAAFACRVGISAVDPADHVPALSPERIEHELRQWRDCADGGELVVWTSEPSRVAQLGCEVRSRVSWSGAWDVTRPTFEAGGTDFDAVRDAVAPFWTFAAARALSPSLARVLEPFGWLDELASDPLPAPDLEPHLEPFAREAFTRWQRHRLPALPSLTFRAQPDGDPSRAVLLVEERDARGVRLRARCPSASRLAIVPALDGASIDRDWLLALERDGLLTLDLASRDGPVDLEVRLAFDAAVVEARDGAGRRLARRVVDGGLYLDGHPLGQSEQPA